MIRKGKDFYTETYERALELHRQGIAVKEISKRLGISYSSVYSWFKSSRAPKRGSISQLTEFLQKNGPMPVVVVRELFPSHDDLYYSARKRGFDINRYNMSSKKVFGKASVWYYLSGQEEELKKRILGMIGKYKEIKEKLLRK